MPPIPVHKNDPISPAAAKPDGVTPQTVDSNPPPTRTVPPSVPASTTADPNSPPAPQPGARPIAPTASPGAPSFTTPPAPQPGGYSATHVTTETRLAGPPPQFNVPPPTDAQLAGCSTATSTEPSKSGPATLNMGAAPAPPGASPYQHERRGGAVQEVPRSSLEGPPGYVQADQTPYSLASGGGQGSVGQDGGVGGAAWNMLARAGEALKKGEEAAWKAVRNNK